MEEVLRRGKQDMEPAPGHALRSKHRHNIDSSYV
jgi:hypothetical protein